MKLLFILALSLSSIRVSSKSLSPPVNLKLGFNDIMEILGGVLVGMGTDLNASDIEPCVVDTGLIGASLEKALEYFLEKTYTGKIKALAELAVAYKELPGMIKTCKPGSIQIAEAIERMVLAFANPLSVLYHMGENLLVNGQDILAEVSYAMGAYEFHEYFEFGFYCGEAGFKIVYVPEGKTKIGSQALNGIANGIIKANNLLPQNCLQESVVGALFSNAFNHDHKFGPATDALADLGTGVEKLFREIEMCSGQKYLRFIQNGINAMKNPSSAAYGKYWFLVNGVDITMFEIAKINYMNQDWENVGFYVGEMVKILG